LKFGLKDGFEYSNSSEKGCIHFPEDLPDDLNCFKARVRTFNKILGKEGSISLCISRKMTKEADQIQRQIIDFIKTF